MSGEPMDRFVWAVMRDGDAATRRADDSARRRGDELDAAVSALWRFANRLLDARRSVRARRGAQVFDPVAVRLRPLESQGWTVLHDLPLGGPGANLDHLVIGPAGIFSVTIVHLTGEVDVRTRTLLHDGEPTACYATAVREASRVAASLSLSLGAPVTVWPVVVVTGAAVNLTAQPDDLTVVTPAEVAGWVAGGRRRLSDEQVTAVARVARDASTWRVQALTG